MVDISPEKAKAIKQVRAWAQAPAPSQTCTSDFESCLPNYQLRQILRIAENVQGAPLSAHSLPSIPR